MKSTAALTIATLTALGVAASASAAMASGFSGKHPLTATQSKGSNGNFCLTLTDDGSRGFPHSGPASINAGINGQPLNGQFQFINHVIIVNITDPAIQFNGDSVYFTRPSNGTLGEGVFAIVRDGDEVDSGEIVFGPKGGC